MKIQFTLALPHDFKQKIKMIKLLFEATKEGEESPPMGLALLKELVEEAMTDSRATIIMTAAQFGALYALRNSKYVDIYYDITVYNVTILGSDARWDFAQ
jgi:hypothetical protein|tara:strand:- start:599 stop:898 length:300 start_codon:yes stop_codon:yes gene_type:complete